MVNQHYVYLAGRLGDVEDWIGNPVHTRHGVAVEGHFLPQRAAHALYDVAFDAFHQSIRIDDLSAIVRNRELSRPNLASRAVDVDLGDNGDAGAVALCVGDATAGHLGFGLVTARRRPRVPFGLLRRSIDDGNVTWVFDVAQAEQNRIGVRRRRHFVD